MSGLIPNDLLDRIRAASDIVDVVGAALPLKRAGSNFVTLCPFHKEKTPSFHVNPQRQIFHCFGCHKGGDVFRFVQDYENLSFIEAVRRLAERARIPLEIDPAGGQDRTRFLKDQLLQLHEQIAQRWQAALRNDASGQSARDYLAKRGVSQAAVDLFRLGAAPEAWDDTVNWARSRGFDLTLVEQGGLIIGKETEAGSPPRYYDRFRGRLMFPICDEQGRVIGFSGRVLAGDEKTAKYVNSPETPLFTKGRVIYGLDKTRRAILDAGRAIICEGQLDLIACYMAGVPNVVAPQGTALTGDHCRILKRYVNEVILCFDSDPAGQNAALRSLDDLLASDLAIRVATVPAPHDPDSFIRTRGGDAFRQLTEQAPDFFAWLLERTCTVEDVRTDRGRSAIVRRMAECLLKTQNAVLIETYAQRTAQRLGVTPDAVWTEFRKTRPAPSGRTDVQTETNGAAAAEASPTRPSTPEFWLLKLLFNNDSTAPWVAQHLDPAWIVHPAVRQLVQHRLTAETEGTWDNVASLLSQIPDPALHQLATEAAADNRGCAQAERQIHDVVRRLRDAALERDIVEVNRQIADPAVDDPHKLVLLRRKHELTLAKRAPLDPRV